MPATLLLDGKTGVSAKELVSNMLKAALLAHEKAGTIRLETEEHTSKDSRTVALIAVPTGKTIEWPPATLESRLLLDKRACVSDLVFDWLYEDSKDPWMRAAEQCKIMLVIRGVANRVSKKQGKARYLFTENSLLTTSKSAAQPVKDLLTHCQQSTPETWDLLTEEINEAVKRRTITKSPARNIDPWLAEAATDRERFVTDIVVVTKVPQWLTMLMGLTASISVYWVASSNDQLLITASTVGILAALIYFLLPTTTTAIDEGERAFIRKQQISWFGAGLPILSLLVVLLFDFIQDNFLIFGALVAAGMFKLLQWKANRAINKRVLDGGEQPCPSVAVQPANSVAYKEEESSLYLRTNSDTIAVHQQAFLATTHSKEVSITSPPSTVHTTPSSETLPELDIIKAEAMPQASAESRRRVDAIWLRGPAITSIYQKGVLTLAGATLLMAIIYWLSGPAPPFYIAEGSIAPEQFPFFLVILFIITTVIAKPLDQEKNSASAKTDGYSNRVKGVEIRILLALAVFSVWRANKARVRPPELMFLGTVWILIALFKCLSAYSHLEQPHALIFIMMSIILSMGYLFWIHQTTRVIERLYPYQPPLNLLALRVFDSASLDDFLELTRAWKWIGTRYRLDGPGTAGSKLSDLVNYISNRVDDSIVENEEELQSALSDFSKEPDGQLRFQVNSMQCNNATWKEALLHLLNNADTIVFNLSDLTNENRGVAYELGKLLDHVPLQRIMFLINDSTDIKVLKEILTKAWQDRVPNSPNHGTSTPRFQMFHMGGLSERDSNESADDVNRRVRIRIDQKNIIALMCDAALPPRIPFVVDPIRDRQWIRWSRSRLPRMIRLAGNFFLGWLIVEVFLSGLGW